MVLTSAPPTANGRVIVVATCNDLDASGFRCGWQAQLTADSAEEAAEFLGKVVLTHFVDDHVRPKTPDPK